MDKNRKHLQQEKNWLLYKEQRRLRNQKIEEVYYVSKK